MIFRRDPFGHLVFVKRVLISLIGWFTYPGLRLFNTLTLSGTSHLKGLPRQKVLFVSNHQTYFADVISLLHVFSSSRWGFTDSIRFPVYLLWPKHDTYFVAAKETMKAGFLPRLFEYVGSVSISRTWREAGKDIRRQVNLQDITNIGTALEGGWVITFPQGTTKAFAPGRRGTAHVIKKYQPVVVPVVIDGFRRTFDKKGLRIKKTGNTLRIAFKAPLTIDYTADADQILAQVMEAIEQSERFYPEAMRSREKKPEN
jgi:1-acyl-sn-glycerol-3-phosphate acyltransferase